MTRASGQADYARCCCRSSIQEPGTVLEGADQGISDKGGVSVKISGRSVSTRVDPELRAHQGRSAALVISRAVRRFQASLLPGTAVESLDNCRP